MDCSRHCFLVLLVATSVGQFLSAQAEGPGSAQAPSKVDASPVVPEPTGAKSRPKPGGRNSWFEATSIDLGSYLEGEKAKAEFKFKNPGSATHKLRNFQPSCACAKTSVRVGGRLYRVENTPSPNSIFRIDQENGVEKKHRVQFVTVGAGESGSVDVAIDLRGVTGKKEATVTLQSTDEELRLMNLRCWAVATTYFRILPPEVNLNKMTWQEKREFVAQVSSPIQADFEITGHDPLPDQMHVEYRKEMKNGRATWIVNGTYGPNVDERAGGGIIKLRTNVKNKKVSIRVIAFVDGPLKIKPGTFISLGLVRRGKGVTRTVEFTPTDDFELQAEKIEISNLTIPEQFVDVITRRDGNVLKVDIKISPDAPRRLVRGDVKVHLNHPLVKTKELQFNGFVR